MALADLMQLLVEREPAGILRMAAIDHVAQRRHPPVRMSEQRHVAQDFAIDLGDLLALAQIVRPPLRGSARRDAEGDAAAGAAAVEAEHEAGPLRRAAMHEGIDAERAVQPGDPRRHRSVKAKPGRHSSEP